MVVSIRIFAPQIFPRLLFSKSRGAVCGLECVNIRIPSDKKIEVPIAEIKLASLLLPRIRNLR